MKNNNFFWRKELPFGVQKLILGPKGCVRGNLFCEEFTHKTLTLFNIVQHFWSRKSTRKISIFDNFGEQNWSKTKENNNFAL